MVLMIQLDNQTQTTTTAVGRSDIELYQLLISESEHPDPLNLLMQFPILSLFI